MQPAQPRQPMGSLRAHGVNIDVQFLNELVQPALETASLHLSNANNVGSLAHLLKMKNSKFAFTEHSRQVGQDWIREKGADLGPLIGKVQTKKRENLVKKQERKSESECHFFLPELTYDNQANYISKNFELGVLFTVQSIMSQDRNKGSLAKRMLSQRAERRLKNQQTYMDALPVVNLQIRSNLKKQQYLRATAHILGLEQGLKGKEWSLYYGKAAKKPFWEIIHNQLAFVLDQPSQDNLVSKLALASLKMVEAEFSAILPTRYEGMLHHLTNHYLGKLKGQYDSESLLGAVWGVSFLLYRAGRKDEFFDTLPKDAPKEARKLFEEAEASLKEGNPKRFTGIEQGSDAFFNQLLYALKGQPKCENEALCNPNDLDVAWVLLRNVGIFPDQVETLRILRRDMYQFYRNSLMTQTKIKNLLYLLGYGEIAELGPNDMMDQDDFLHFLIAIYRSPLLNCLNREKRELLESRLGQELLQYIQELLLENRHDYVNYMVLMPSSKVVEEISSIIASSHLLETLNWGLLANRLKPDIYQKLVQESLQKYVAFHQDYIQVARKACELLNNNKAALDFILEMFIKSVLYSRMEPEELRKGNLLANDILARDELARKEYGPVFTFFQEYARLRQIVGNRDENNAYSFLRESHFILLSDQLTDNTKQALGKLMERKGFECYILYLRDMVKVFEIAFLRTNKDDSLREVSGLVLNALIELLRGDPYNQFVGLEAVKELLRLLEESCGRASFDN